MLSVLRESIWIPMGGRSPASTSHAGSVGKRCEQFCAYLIGLDESFAAASWRKSPVKNVTTGGFENTLKTGEL